MNQHDDFHDFHDVHGIHDLLETALGGEPTGSVDPDALIRLGRRRVRLRRAAASVGVMAVAGLIIIGATLLPSAMSGNNHVSTATGGQTVTVSPSAGNSVLDARLGQDLAAVVPSLSTFNVTRGSLNFMTKGPISQLDAELVDSRGAGTLSITHEERKTPFPPEICDASAGCVSTNHVLNQTTVPVALTTTAINMTPYGIKVTAVATLGNVRITASSSNVASGAHTWTRPAPPISNNQLGLIAAVLAQDQ